jgi:hypothetical protein
MCLRHPPSYAIACCREHPLRTHLAVFRGRCPRLTPSLIRCCVAMSAHNRGIIIHAQVGDTLVPA